MKYFFCSGGKPSAIKRLTIKFLFVFFLCCVSCELYAQQLPEDIVELERIVVTSQRRPVERGALSRSVAVIEEQDIKNLPVNSTEAALGYIQGVDARSRGVFGTQADISIRGSSFEQVLVLIDGIKMNDPQTAHHNMNLPLSIDDIQRIEVLRGGSASLYGANAYGGVINIITKRPQEEKIEFKLTIGEHSLSSQNLSVDVVSGVVSSHLSFDRKESSGYRPDTDFENLTVYVKSLIDAGILPLDLNAGYIKKDFGASTFYSNLYPHQEEHIDGRFISLRTNIDRDWVKITPAFFYRRHWDKFILDRNRPWWFVNFHTTYTYGGELKAEFDLGKNFLILGLEGRQEKITSTNLGKHSRDNEALFSMYNLKLSDKSMLNIGLREDYFEKWGWQHLPSVSGNYFLNSQLKLRGAVNRLFRVPSYTELYYSSPANRGNEDLVPEKGWSYETGFDIIKGDFELETTLFLRKEKNVIDWARNSEVEAWQAQNVSSLKTRGIETEISFSPLFLKEKFSVSSVNCGYTYLYATHSSEAPLNKYSPDYLKHQAHMGLDLSLPFDLRQTLKLGYKERISQKHYFLLDSKISKRIEKEKFALEFFVGATNLLNTSYNEIAGVAMPGRWAEAGLCVEF